MKKIESYNPQLNFSLPTVNGEISKNIYIECLKYADEYAASIPEMDDNTYVMLICNIIAQKHMCDFNSFSCTDIFSDTLTSKFVDEKKLLYFSKIDEAFSLMSDTFESKSMEYYIGFLNQYDFHQSESQNLEPVNYFLDTIIDAIAICPQYEYAYCFLVVEFASAFMGITLNTDSPNAFSEYYYKAYNTLDKETFDFLFTGDMDCSYSYTKFAYKYGKARTVEELSEELRKEYYADMQYYKNLNSYIEYLEDKKIKDGCIKSGNQKYKIGIPFSKLVPSEKKSEYLLEYFTEEKTTNFDGHDIFPHNIDPINNIIYKDEEKTFYIKNYQTFRGFSYYMPKIEVAPLESTPLLLKLTMQNMTKIIMQRSQSELDIQRRNLSIQNQLSRLRSEEMNEEDVDRLITEVVVYYDEREGTSEVKKGLATKQLELEFGSTTWNRISNEVKKMLISAEITYNSLAEIDDVDYSPAIIPLTKALENILNEYIYHKGIYQYLCKNNMSDKKDYSELYYWDKKKQKKCPKQSLTMGAFKIMFENYQTYAGGKLKEILNYNSERKVIIDQISVSLKCVHPHRNLVAHKDGVGAEVMKECRDKIILEHKAIIKNIFRLI